MPRPPDVLVVGAGAIGASVAWHLASRGCENVRVIDRGEGPGAGSTPRATGGYRAQFGTDINVRLSLLARRKLLRFRQEVGADPGYRPVGYLFVAFNEEQLVRLRKAQSVQRAAGLEEARMVSPEKVATHNPAISPDAVVGGAFCATDGFIDPMQIQRGYMLAAQRLGARFEFGVEYDPRSRAPIVVNAAGAWAGRVGDVPVTPLRRQVLPTIGVGTLTADLPMTIFVQDAFHFRVRDGRALLLWPGGRNPVDPFDTSVDPAWMDRVEKLARRRVPGLNGASFDRAGAWAGLYEMSPDGHAILGRVNNMVFANGSSGHGVMHSPALGQLAAEFVLDGHARSLDVHPLRPSRFAEGDPVRGVEVF